MPESGDLPPDPHIDPQAWAELQHRKYATSLKVWFSGEFGWASLLDPFTGEVHTVELASAPKWFMYRCFDERRRRVTHRR
jgi:hypothetical protein